MFQRDTNHASADWRSVHSRYRQIDEQEAIDVRSFRPG